MPVAGCAALQALRDLGGVCQGAKVLINGGAGGVGHFAVQIAKSLGAVTTATCGSSNAEFVRSLGADSVIDYSQWDFTVVGDRYDVVFDAVGKSAFSVCRDILAPGGTYVTTLPSPNLFLWGDSARRKDIRPRQAGEDAHGQAERRGSRLSRSSRG